MPVCEFRIGTGNNIRAERISRRAARVVADGPDGRKFHQLARFQSSGMAEEAIGARAANGRFDFALGVSVRTGIYSQAEQIEVEDFRGDAAIWAARRGESK